MDDECQSDNHAGCVNLLGMIESRIVEIKSLNEECKRKLPKQASQRLPRFLRRRAASHNIKRIPKKLRPRNQNNAKSFEQKLKKLKRYRDRKAFRKNKTRRARKKRLESQVALLKLKTPLHTWSAKRFTMIKDSLWMPFKNTTKNQRNLYRNYKNGCSFFYLPNTQPLSIICKAGMQHPVITNLNKVFVSSSTGFTFASKLGLSGQYEVQVKLYKPNSYPYEFLCPISCMWLTDCHLQLWIPHHGQPSIYDIVKRAIESALVDLISNEFVSIIDYSAMESSYLRFRTIGPKCANEINRCLIAFKKCNSISIDLKHILRNPDRDFLFDLPGYSVARINRLPFTFDEHESDSMKSQPTFEMIVCDYRSSNRELAVIDLLVPISCGTRLKNCAKSVWCELIKNRSHLVGGLRDLESLALNYPTQQTFPWFNCCDCVIIKQSLRKVFQETLSQLRPLYNSDLNNPSLMVNFPNGNDIFIVRDEIFFDKLRCCKNHVSIEQLLKRFKTAIHNGADERIFDIEKALINVEIRLTDKGTVRRGDIIMYADENNDQRQYFVCGLIESGGHSLFTGCGRGYGVIALKQLVNVVRLAKIQTPDCKQQNILRLDRYDLAALVVCKESGDRMRHCRLRLRIDD